MEESGLLKLSLLCSLIGLVSMALVAGQITGTNTKIGDIEAGMKGMAVKVCGNLTEVHVSEAKHVFLGLADSSGSISVVVFNSTAMGMEPSPYKLGVGELVCVDGEVGVYRGEVEVIAERLTRDSEEKVGIFGMAYA